MKVVRYGALLALVALSLSLGLVAKDKKDKNEAKFTLADSVQIGSNELKAGNYKAIWDSSGPDVEVKILQGNNVVATAPAKLVDESSEHDSVTLADPSKLLQEIHFGSLHKSLVFSPAVAAQN
jgi:hypothetical protein